MLSEDQIDAAAEEIAGSVKGLDDLRALASQVSRLASNPKNPVEEGLQNIAQRIRAIAPDELGDFEEAGYSPSEMADESPEAAKWAETLALLHLKGRRGSPLVKSLQGALSRRIQTVTQEQESAVRDAYRLEQQRARAHKQQTAQALKKAQLAERLRLEQEQALQKEHAALRGSLKILKERSEQGDVLLSGITDRLEEIRSSELFNPEYAAKALWVLGRWTNTHLRELYQDKTLAEEHKDLVNSELIQTCLKLCRSEQARTQDASMALQVAANLELRSDDNQALLAFQAERAEELNDMRLAIALWSACTLDLDPDASRRLLDQALQRQTLERSAVSYCFAAAVYLDHHVQEWTQVYEASGRPQFAEYSSRDPYADPTRGEKRVREMIGDFMQAFEIDAKTHPVEMEGDLYCYKGDMVLNFPGGAQVDIEYDGGPFHQFHQGQNAYRDTVLLRLGIDTLRIGSADVDKYIRLKKKRDPESLRRFLAQMFGRLFLPRSKAA